MKRIGDRIRHSRECKKWSQLKLAARSGLHANTIGNYERGDSSPNADRLQAVAGALGVDARRLVDGVATMVSEASSAPDGGHLSIGFDWLPFVPRWDGTPDQGGHDLWPVPQDLVSGDRCLVIRVRDDAMRPFLMAGDAIVVGSGDLRLRSLATMVVRVDDEVLIRRFVARKRVEVFLTPLNNSAPIVVRSDHEVLARVVAIVGRNLMPSVAFEYLLPWGA